MFPSFWTTWSVGLAGITATWRLFSRLGSRGSTGREDDDRPPRLARTDAGSEPERTPRLPARPVNGTTARGMVDLSDYRTMTPLSANGTTGDDGDPLNSLVCCSECERTYGPSESIAPKGRLSCPRCGTLWRTTVRELQERPDRNLGDLDFEAWRDA